MPVEAVVARGLAAWGKRRWTRATAPASAGLVAICLTLAPGMVRAQSEPSPVTARATSGPATSTSTPARAGAARENYPLEIIGPKELQEIVRTRTLIGRWQRRADYDPIQFEGLLARAQDEVVAILLSEGYFGGVAEITGDANGVRIDIDARARTTVNTVVVSVIGPGGSDPRVRDFALERWSLPEGAFFKTEVWEQSKRALVDALQQQGYLRARIAESRAGVDVENTTAAVAVVVDSGPLIGFGPLHVSGLGRYRQAIVDNLSPFRAGEPYALDQLLLFQTRLRDSGYFSSASVVPDLQALEAEPRATEVAILVELVELQSQRIALGIGFSADHGVRGQVGYENRNVLDRGWRLESALTLESQRQRLFANVRTPAQETGHFYGFGGSLERLDVEGEQSDKSNIYFGLGRRSEDIESFWSIQHQAERRRIDVLAGPATDETRRALVLSYSWNLRRLDSTFDPRDGYTLSAQISGAREGIFSDRSFLRTYARAMRFIPMARDSSLAGGTVVAMLELGVVLAQSREDIPTENLFRAGGAGSVRGYRYQQLGVLENGATVGGRYLAVASLEYQHPLRENLLGAVFVDLGNAADSPRELSPALGIGVGARMRTPVGPINVDLAWGNEAKRVRLHFSFGYTF